VREGSTNADPAGDILSAMGIVPLADVVPKPPDAPLHVRSRASSPGPYASGAARRALATLVRVSDAGAFGAGAIRALAGRHGIRPKRSLGQHFLIDPNLARAIVADADVRSGDQVVEIGAGLGSLTRALVEAGADVLAVEVDEVLIPALEESVGGLDRVRILRGDAMGWGWAEHLQGPGAVLCANLPYNVATPLVLETLDRVPEIERLVVMVQREVGERLAAKPSDEAYGIPSLRVAYRADARLVRRVPPAVFWPRPRVESVIVRIDRLATARVAVDPERLWRVVDAGFAGRRKTMRNAVRRLGAGADAADRLLTDAGIDPAARAETLSIEDFARLARAVPA
jgi:16S rRNA (adenine1518-N6/adenine1519-N6)-dimethyltransferase